MEMEEENIRARKRKTLLSRVATLCDVHFYHKLLININTPQVVGSALCSMCTLLFAVEFISIESTGKKRALSRVASQQEQQVISSSALNRLCCPLLLVALP